MGRFQNIDEFVEKHVEGEKLTTTFVSTTIKRYLHSNIAASDKKKVAMYEHLFFSLADALHKDDNVTLEKLLENVERWVQARLDPIGDANENLYRQNMSIYNIAKV